MSVIHWPATPIVNKSWLYSYVQRAIYRADAFLLMMYQPRRLRSRNDSAADDLRMMMGVA